ncbi:CRISPR-associated helicase Cas3' [Gordonia asplenii]|nr:CRISPR-associated helicase Cas3' [Gordonia asplenii]
MSHRQPRATDNPAATLSPQARSLWAKADATTGESMRLHQHMEDAGGVTAWLWDHVCAPHLKQRIAADLGDDEALARRVVTWLAAAHDLGKASPVFCSGRDPVVAGLADRICATGLTINVTPDERRKLPHSAVSELALRDWLAGRHRMSVKTANTFAAIPGGHHGRYPTHEQLKQRNPRLDGDDAWQTVQFELADFCAMLADMSDGDFETLSGHPLTQPAAIAITGLVIMGDWIASNVEFFEFVPKTVQAQRVRRAMERLALPELWTPSPPTSNAELYETRFDIDNPRPMQSALLDLARTIEEPELIVVESPTGEGKTAAALAAAEVLAERFGLGGIAFALPTRATSDAIFSTVTKWIPVTLGSSDTSIALVHSTAKFNDDFTEIPKSSHIYDDLDDDCMGEAIAHWWLSGRGKTATLSNIVVCTIDQVLLAALAAKHVVLRQLGLAGKVVVIDEVHAADTFMTEYLKSALMWLGAFEVPVIALTATLPPAHRNALVNAYNKGRKRRSLTVDSSAYPVLTHTGTAGCDHLTFAASSRSSSVTIEELSGGPEDIAAQALIETTNGGHAAIVCNTVTRAQAVYRDLAASASDEVEVVLLHSRFVLPHRLRIEHSLRERLGPGVVRSPTTKLIVVATQVIEQSLDLDFDVMFTDIAPVDLIIQRIGRLHRHDRSDDERAPKLRSPRVILTGFERCPDDAPRLDRGCALVYGASSLLRALAVLDDHRARIGPLRSPDDVAVLVTEAYRDDLSAPPGWDEAWAAAERTRRAADNDRAERARGFALPAPRRDSLIDFATVSVGDTDGEKGIAQVRDSEDSIEVVVVQRNSRRRLVPTAWSDIDADRDLDLGPEIDDDVARKLAREVVRLPSYLGRGRSGDDLIEELEQQMVDSWQQSRWLRGMLPLILDSDGHADVSGHSLDYDLELGLIVDYQEAL